MFKKIIIALIMSIITVSVNAFAVDIDSIIPNSSLWGCSRDELKEVYDVNFTPCNIGKKKGLMISDVSVESYNMNEYFVFNERMNTPQGQSYLGLSKIALILNGKYEKDFRKQCYNDLVDDMKNTYGEPDSEENYLSVWNRDEYKVQIGTGKFEKYTGSKDYSVAIIITGININTTRAMNSPTV